MYSILLTFVAVTFAYPYANYGQYPAYSSYYQTVPNYRVRGQGPVLRNNFPFPMMMGMGGMGGMGGAPGSGGQGGARGGAPGGGMGGMFGPGGYIMQILNMFAPGIAQNPMMGSMMYGIDGGDWNDLFEGAMKGDFEKITNKLYDGGFDGDMMFPMMAGLFGGAGQRGGGQQGGASGASPFGGFNPMMGMMGMGMPFGPMMGGGRGPAAPAASEPVAALKLANPMSMFMMDAINKPHVVPANARLMRALQETASAEAAAGTGAGATEPTGPAPPTGGMGYGPYGFMNAMNNIWSNPMAMGAMGMTLDGSDMQDIAEAYTKGDVYEIMSKTMGKGFNPYAFQGRGPQGPGASGPRGPGGPGAGPRPGTMGGFFGNMGFGNMPFMMNPFMMELMDFDFPFF